MKCKLLEQHSDERTFVLVFSTGDEFTREMMKFAEENKLTASHFTAIGAFQRATLAYFDWETKEYVDNPIEEQMEVLSLLGDITLNEGKPKIHAHGVVGLRDGATRGGHIKAATVRPTLEVTLQELPALLHREHDPESGLALIKLD